MSLAKKCMAFRLKHFAPSGGWLASLVIPIATATGLYDFTLLGFVLIFVVKIMLSSSCEAAIILGLGFDFTIPCQYHNAGVHTKELSEYWPKMILATAVEMACYVLLEPDLFNVIALVKTLITFSLWMKDEKQWPLVFPDGRDKKSSARSSRPDAPRNGSDRQSRSEKSQRGGTGGSGGGGGGGGSGSRSAPGNPLVTDDYLQYVADNFKDLGNHEKQEKKDEFKRLMQDLLRKPDEARYQHAMKKLKSNGKNVDTPEEYAKRKAGGGTAPQGQPAAAAAAAGATGAGASAGTAAGSTSGTQGGQTARQSAGTSSSKKGQTLSKQEYERVSKLCDELRDAKTRNPIPSKVKTEYRKILRSPIDDREFQTLARMLNKLENIGFNLPIIEWKPPPAAEIQSVLDRCKAAAAGESEEDRARRATEEILKRIRETIEKGPYDASNWDAVVDFCKYNRRIVCPDWLDPPPRFQTGYWIPYETQTDLIKRIVNSDAPNDKVRGICDAVEFFHSSKEKYIKTMTEVMETAKLQLDPLQLGEESEYLPFSVTVFDAPRSLIFVSANHWREAKELLSLDDELSGSDAREFDAAVANFEGAYANQNAKAIQACTEVVTARCFFDDFGRRTEHYTDFHGGRLGLDYKYLNALRGKWQTAPYQGRLPRETVDTILYATKMSDSRAAAEELVNKFNEAVAGPGDAWYKLYRQYEHLSASEREGTHLSEKCRLLGDTFDGGGAGIQSSRITHYNDKYQ